MKKEITKEDIIKYCEEYNHRKINPVSDKVIEDAFKEKYTPSNGNNLLRTELIDNLWHTHLGMKSKKLKEVSEKIDKILPDIDKQLSQLTKRDVLKIVSEKDEAILKNCIYDIYGCFGSDKKRVSFACKYLHFLEPNLFAPWDNLVPKAAHKFGHRLLGRESVDKYLSLLKIYKKPIEGIKEWDEIIQLDKKGCGKENTKLRILDKVFWTIGKNLGDKE